MAPVHAGVKTIRELRNAQGWTQLELAYRLKVTPATVSNWECGRYAPSASSLRLLARTFGVSMDAIDIVDPGRPGARSA